MSAAAAESGALLRRIAAGSVLYHGVTIPGWYVLLLTGDTIELIDAEIAVDLTRRGLLRWHERAGRYVLTAKGRKAAHE